MSRFAFLVLLFPLSVAAEPFIIDAQTSPTEQGATSNPCTIAIDNDSGRALTAEEELALLDAQLERSISDGVVCLESKITDAKKSLQDKAPSGGGGSGSGASGGAGGTGQNPSQGGSSSPSDPANGSPGTTERQAGTGVAQPNSPDGSSGPNVPNQSEKTLGEPDKDVCDYYRNAIGRAKSEAEKQENIKAGREFGCNL